MSQLFNPEAERGLLGGLIIDESSYDDIDVAVNDFYREQHALIFTAIEWLRQGNHPVDLISVCDRLAANDTLARIGGAVYVAELLDSTTGDKRYIENYAKIVKILSLKRQTMKVCQLGVERIKTDRDGDFQSVLAEIQSQILNIGHASKEDYASMSQVMRDTQDHIEFAIANAGQVTGVPTGYESLNKITGGWQDTDLIIVAARPGMGKTALMLNLLENGAREGIPVGIFSCEMSKRQLGYRLAARRTHVPVQRMINGLLSPDDSRSLAEATSLIGHLPIHVDDRGGLTDMDIIKTARRMVRDHGVRCVGIDYLQRIDPADKVGKKNEDVGQMCKNFKNMAKALEIPVILLAQLNRKVEERDNKRPLLADLKDSGDIEQEADIIAFIYRDDYYNKKTEHPGIAEIDLAKYRNGRPGMVRMAWDGVSQEFSDIRRAI